MMRKRKFLGHVLRQDRENNVNIVLTRGQKDEERGKIKRNVEAYHQNRKNSRRVANTE